MSGGETVGKAVDQILQKVNLASIPDEQTREGVHECLRQLLNLVEALNTELQKAQAEILALRQRLQGKGGGGPSASQRETSTSGSRSSEKERAEGEEREHGKRSKLDRIRIDREEVLKVDRTTLPPDAEFKGYAEVVVQDLRLSTDHVKFRKEKYYAASTGKTYLAPLPAGYSGEFGPNLKSLCLVLVHECNMTEPKVAALLENLGVVISAGQISNLLRAGQEEFQKEKDEIVEAGLSSSPWQHLDDTGTRVDGENWHGHGLCNPWYTAYFTTPRKDRMTVLDVLRNQRERVFRLHGEALELLHQWGVAKWVREGVTRLAWEEDESELELNRRLEGIPDLGGVAHDRIAEAAAIAAYHADRKQPVVRLLVCDDAKQFRWLTEELALCWIHDGRHYQNLEPCVGQHREKLEAFRKKYWEYYRHLRTYTRAPTPEGAAERREQFETLFSTRTGYEVLDRRIAKTQTHRRQLLQVLQHPEIPLHNNPGELEMRRRVRKRVVSYGPRSAQGAQVWDAMETLIGTAKKLGVNIFHYLRDRVSGARAMPSLAGLIGEKAKALNLGSSWATTT